MIQDVSPEVGAEARARAGRSAKGNAGKHDIVYFTDGTEPTVANQLEERVGVTRQAIMRRYRLLREQKAEVTIESLKRGPAK